MYYQHQKNDKDKHGYGLKNIKEQCEKYQGSMEINIENAIFQLILSFLKNIEVSRKDTFYNVCLNDKTCA